MKIKRYHVVILFILLFLTIGGCDSKSSSEYNVAEKYTERPDPWIKLGEAVVGGWDGQPITVENGIEITNEFNVGFDIALLKTISADFGYNFSVSTSVSTGTSVTINKDDTLQFYYRRTYKIHDVFHNKSKDDVFQLAEMSVQYGYKRYDSNKNLIEDTTVDPSDPVVSDPLPAADESNPIEASQPTTVEEPFVEPVTGNCESEPNNELHTADKIAVNVTCEGLLDNEDDLDYYMFTLEQKGAVSISFQHAKIDSDSAYWKISLLDSAADDIILDFYSPGNAPVTKSNQVRLSAGKYYICVDNYYFSDIPYELSVNYSAESSSYETEPNNDFAYANQIELNKEYTGNLQTDHDLDYFNFNIPSSGKVSVTFQHEKFDTTASCWEIILYNDIDDSRLLNFYSSGLDTTMTSDFIRLPAGVYYLKIKPFSYKSIDYKFTINYIAETDAFEKEPDNDFITANPILFSAAYTGNIQSEKDADFYRFSLTDNRPVMLLFIHAPLNSSSTYWKVTFYRHDTDGSICSFYMSGNLEKAQETTPELPPGEYYIKITGFSYSNIDYTFSIN